MEGNRQLIDRPARIVEFKNRLKMYTNAGARTNQEIGKAFMPLAGLL